MVHQNCVIILGAGASHPYGFPCGDDFRRQLIRFASNPPPVCQSHAEVFKTFALQFEQSNLSSIDRFLGECNRRKTEDVFPNKELIQAGKAAIAHVLLPQEDKESVVQDWYGHLVELLTHRHFPDLGKRLTIISFNYDRSLEFHLLRSLAAIVGSRKVQGDRLKGLVEIIHVYGQLGGLPGLDDGPDAVPYGGAAQHMANAIKGIRVIGERADETHLKLIQERINNATALVFIGFGFLEENVELLAIPNDARIRAFASALGLSRGRKELLRQQHQGVQWVFGESGANATKFLHDTDIFAAIGSIGASKIGQLARALTR